MKKAPMGWNSWDCYGAGVDEATVRKNAEFMTVFLKRTMRKIWWKDLRQ